MTHAEKMARFLSGYWTKERPTEPGVYPMRDCDGNEFGPGGWLTYFADPTNGKIRSVPGRGMSAERWSVPWPGMPGEGTK